MHAFQWGALKTRGEWTGKARLVFRISSISMILVFFSLSDVRYAGVCRR